MKTLHSILNINTSHIRNHEINLVIRGISRNNPHHIKQAEPITPQILIDNDIYKEIDHNDPVHVTHWCLFLFAFFLMARKSNLVPNSSRKFNPQKQLMRSDVFQDEDLLLVIIKWSKTNQFGKRQIRVPLISIPQSPLCPITAYTNMCMLIPSYKCSAAFQIPSVKGNKPVSYRQYQTFLKHILSKINRNPNIYSTHSFRRGGATWAFQSNVPGELIQLQGDWKSEVYKQYLCYSDKEKLITAQKNESIYF